MLHQLYLLPCQVRSRPFNNLTLGVREGREIPLEVQKEQRPNSGLFLSKHFERNQSDDDVEERAGLSPQTAARLMKTQGSVPMNHCQSSP